MTDASIATAPFRVTTALMHEVARLRPAPRGLTAAYFFALALMLVAILTVHELFRGAPLLQIAGFIAIAFATILLVIFYRRTIFAWYLKRTPALEAEIVVSIDEGGVRIRNAMMEGWVSWPGVLLVRETARGVFIFAQAATAYSIPRAAFADAAAAQRFAAAAHRYWRVAHS